MSSPAIITVRFTRQGFHRWPSAPQHRAYLAQRHRHLFHVECSMAVAHDDRDVEFHDMLDFCRGAFVGGEMGDWSCELMARTLAKEIARRYGRAATVAVFEDGEVGATVTEAPTSAN